jgi:molecular chaperone DnaJ
MNFILKEIGLLGLALFLIFLTNTNFSFSENVAISIDDDFYAKSDIISIWGSTLDAPQNLVFISIVDPDGNTVWTEKISVDEEGDFSTLVIAGVHGWVKSGIYEISLESGEVINTVSFFYDSGLQVNPPSAVDDVYITQEDLILTFVIAISVVVGIFVFLARNIILRKRTKYDELNLDSKKDRDYEKYHSDWSNEEFGTKKNSSINQKEFNEMLKNKTLPNYYEVLGIPQTATSNEIKEKFRLLAKEWHPDKRKDSSDQKMTEINNAYEVLSNPELRDKYDKYFKLL